MSDNGKGYALFISPVDIPKGKKGYYYGPRELEVRGERVAIMLPRYAPLYRRSVDTVDSDNERKKFNELREFVGSDNFFRASDVVIFLDSTPFTKPVAASSDERSQRQMDDDANFFSEVNGVFSHGLKRFELHHVLRPLGELEVAAGAAVEAFLERGELPTQSHNGHEWKEMTAHPDFPHGKPDARA